VIVSAVPTGPGVLTATLSAQTSAGTPGVPVGAGAIVPLPGDTIQVTLLLQRQNPGAASLVSFVVSDIRSGATLPDPARPGARASHAENPTLTGMEQVGTGGDPGSPNGIVGEIEPRGDGEWLTLRDAHARLGVQPKTLYRRAKRGQVASKLDNDRNLLLIWVPREQEPGSREPGSLAVPGPDGPALVVLEDTVARAVAPLAEMIASQQARIEALIRENERLRLAGERRSRWWEPGSWRRWLLTLPR